MNPFKDHLETLKTKLATENNFSDIYDYFFTYLGENPKFMDYGKPVKKPELKATLKKFGEYLFEGEDVQITHFMIIQAKKTKFYHGSCFINGCIAGIFYFEDIEMGMAGVSMSHITGQTEFFRFTSTRIEGNKNVAVPPGWKKTIH
jgi:hypothetical protein